jgi:hypothetical protein
VRFSIDEYSKIFKISHEMVHNKLKTKRLNSIIDNGVTYIVVPRHALTLEQKNTLHEASKSVSSPPAVSKSNVGIIISLYQKENHHLKLKIKELEAKIDKLIDAKEQMLIQERNRIEEIYTSKDEQLKNILEVLSTKLALTPQTSVHDVDISPPQSTIVLNQNGLLELKRYLKFIGIGNEDRKIIRNRFAARYGSDIRILQKNGIFYVDLSKYDYTDLL